MDAPKIDIHLYMTTHDDELPDLHTMEHVEEAKTWFSQVDNVAVHHNHFSKINDELIKEASKHQIMNVHSIVFYPPGKVMEANQVGMDLKKFFLTHKKNFDWHVAPNNNLKDVFEVYLEIIVKNPNEATETKTEKTETLEERNYRILQEAHTEQNQGHDQMQQLNQTQDQ